MDKFTVLEGVCAPLMFANIDTDMIIPKQFLKIITKTGLKSGFLYDFRYDSSGNIKTDFVLNKPEYQDTKILITGENFGCGSSREHAPWAIFDYGIKCIIAPSFASIFYNNCFNNGIFPLILEKAEIDLIVKEISESENKVIKVDLPQQIISTQTQNFNFNIDSVLKNRLLNGLDKIEITLQHKDKISEYEANVKQKRPWEQLI